MSEQSEDISKDIYRKNIFSIELSQIPKPPRTPKMPQNKSGGIPPSSNTDFGCIPAHSLNIIDNPVEKNTESNLGYNFEELDFHEENNTVQEEYSLKQSKFKSKKMQELASKYSDRYNDNM